MDLKLDLPPEAVEAIAQRAAAIVAERISPPRESYLDHAAAAEYIAASPKRLYDLVCARAVPVFKDGSRNLYRRTDLDAYVEGRLEQ